MLRNLKSKGALIGACFLMALSGLTLADTTPVRTILMVWDGLRPDLIDAGNTPNLFALKKGGVFFEDHHATYPTFTMMNAASLATGAYPARSGFYGNTFWVPPAQRGLQGHSATGSSVDYGAPVFTEDYAILDTLNQHYDGRLLLVKTLFEAASEAGYVTATIGKSGPAYLMGLGQHTLFLDENTVQPRAFAAELQASGWPLPVNTVKNYHGGEAVVLSKDNGDPTGRAPYVTFKTHAFDPAGQLTLSLRDPSDETQGEPADAANAYMMRVFTDFILPKKNPMLSVIWFRTPDNVEHGYGPGAANTRQALHSQDQRLGELMTALQTLGLTKSTNLVIVSDHGHSTVSGPLSVFPLRAIEGTTAPNGPVINGSTSGETASRIGAVSGRGYSFSGDVRSADLLSARGFHAFDGYGCAADPQTGLFLDGRPLLPLKLDVTGELCGIKNTKYQSITASRASFKVPKPEDFPQDGVVVAGNGGSDYFYVPSHDLALVKRLVRLFQSRPEYGAIFLDDRYQEDQGAPIPGTLPLSVIGLGNHERQGAGQPDIVVSLNWDQSAEVKGMPGIEFGSFGPGQHGMHGSFSPRDVHNVLMASGPSFKTAFVDRLPSANVDVATTLAEVLGLVLPDAAGRVLGEALIIAADSSVPTVSASTLRSAAVEGLRMEWVGDLTGETLDPALPQGRYSSTLALKEVRVGQSTYRYLDQAEAHRQ